MDKPNVGRVSSFAIKQQVIRSAPALLSLYKSVIDKSLGCGPSCSEQGGCSFDAGPLQPQCNGALAGDTGPGRVIVWSLWIVMAWIHTNYGCTLWASLMVNLANVKHNQQ